MRDKQVKISILCALGLFLFIGSMFYEPLLFANTLPTVVGETPSDTNEDLDASSIDGYSYKSGGANIGVYGYTNGTQTGSYSNTTIWNLDTGRGNYRRPASSITFPIETYPNEQWNVKKVNVEVSGLQDTANYAVDGSFLYNNWTTTNTTYQQSAQYYGTQNLVVPSITKPFSCSGTSSYFNGKNGIEFTIGPKKVQSTITGTPVITNVNNSIVDQIGSFQHTWALKNQGDNEYANHEYLYYSSSPDRMVNSTQNATYASNVASFSSTLDVGTNNTAGHGQHLNSRTLVSPTDSWHRFSGDDDTQARAEFKWEFVKNYTNSIDYTLNYAYDGVVPQGNVQFSYDLNTTIIHPEFYVYRWSDRDKSLQSTSSIGESIPADQGGLDSDYYAYSNVIVYLVHPSGFIEQIDSYDIGYGKNGNASRTVSFEGSKLSSSGTYKIRYVVTNYLQNKGNQIYYGKGYYVSFNWGGWVQSRCELTVSQKNSINTTISKVNFVLNDESPWDDGVSPSGQYKYLSYTHNAVLFDQRSVLSDPTIEFDWFVPAGIAGYGYTSGSPAYSSAEVLGLENARVFARIWYDKGAGFVASPIQYGEYISNVRNRANFGAWSINYPWLWSGDDATRYGHAHFVVTWTNGGSVINGSNQIKLEIGFEFPETFCPDYLVGSGSGVMADRSLKITNTSMTIKTAPKANANGLNMQIVWNKQNGADSSYYNAYPLSSSSGGTGYAYLTDTSNYLNTYRDSSNQLAQWYFRINSTTLSAQFSYSITMVLEYTYWGYTTTYSISVSGNATFYASMQIYIPKNDTFAVPYQNNFEFDVIFPRYMMQTNGEPYWDLYSAYETNHTMDIFYGREVPGNYGTTNVLVYENDTSYYQSILSSFIANPYLAQYHQYARFRKNLIYNSMTYNIWNITFTHPNYAKNVLLSEGSTPKNLFFVNAVINATAQFSTDMTYNRGTGDTVFGTGSMNVYYPNNGQITEHILTIGSGNGLYYTKSDLWTVSQSAPANSGYSVSFYFNDSHVCGDAYTVGGTGTNYYSSGVYKVAYNYTEFSAMRNSLNPVVSMNMTTIDGLYTLNTNSLPEVIRINLNWSDVSSLIGGITGAEVKITIYNWERGGDEDKVMVPDSDFNNVTMIEQGNGNYSISFSPEYYGHPGTLTWGYHNFTIWCNRGGYLEKIYNGAFSIIMDTYMEVSRPSHNSCDGTRPNFEIKNCYALDIYIMNVVLKLNDTSGGTAIRNDSGDFKGMVRGTYQAIGYLLATDAPDADLRTDLTRLLPYSFLDKPENSMYRSALNGTLNQTTTSEFEISILWPSVEITEKGPDYGENIRVYYNITMWVEQNRTFYTENGVNYRYLMPHDVKSQSCADEKGGTGFKATSEELVREEIIGIRVQREGTANLTDLFLLDYEIDNNAFDNGGTYRPFDTLTLKEDYIITNYWYNSTKTRFRLRVALNQTRYALGGGIITVPPCGPLNYTTNHWGNDTSGWSSVTQIFMTGWGNGTDIFYFHADTVNQWSMTYDGGTKTVYGDTYYSDWIYFSSTTAGYHELKVQSNKTGYVDSYEIVKVYITPQQTNVINDSMNEVFDQTDNRILMNVPVGMQTSVIIRFNDTTNKGSSYVGITGATINCTSDNWDDRFSNDKSGVNWKWQELGNGRYNITIINTESPVFSPNEYLLKMVISKQNYTSTNFNIRLNVTKRNIDVIYFGGIDTGPYYPTYLTGYLVDMTRVNLTVRLLDLTNNSVDVPEISDPNSYFDIRRVDNGELVTYFVTKFQNVTGIFYNISIKTNFDIPYGSESTSLNLNINFKYHNRYYDDTVSHMITITAIETEIQMITSASQVAQYLINGSSSYLEYSPHFQFNITDKTWGVICFNRNYPLDIGSMELFSNFSNPNRNGYDAISYGSDCEDIMIIKKFGLHGGTTRYEYMDICVDHRALNVADWNNKQFNITIVQQNYKNVTQTLILTIVNASTKFSNDRIEFATIYTHTDRGSAPNWEATGSNRILWDISTVQDQSIEVPWGMIFAVKVSLKTVLGDYQVYTDSFGAIVQTMTGLITGIEPKYDEKSQMIYFYFWAEPSISGNIENKFNITVWKVNFQPISWEINMTVRNRATSLSISSNLNQKISWSERMTVNLRYTDLEILNPTMNGIQGAVINGTTSGVVKFAHTDFPEGLNATWTLSEESSGVYILRIDTNELIASNDPYNIIFNMSKLGADGLVHWDEKLFVVNLNVDWIRLNITKYAVPFGEEFSESYKLSIPYYGINPEQYTGFRLYLKVSIKLSGETYYITDQIGSPCSMTINLSVCDWNTNTGVVNSSTIRMQRTLTYDTQIGAWVAEIPLDERNIFGDIHLTFTNGIVIDFVTSDPNIEDKVGENGDVINLIVMKGGTDVPSWFWLVFGIVASAGVGMAGYGVKRILLLRIPYVLRMIDETIDKITSDKFPTVGVMTGRNDEIINRVIDSLTECGIEWDIEDKVEADAGKEKEGDEFEGQPPLTKEQLIVELNKIPTITPDERELFIEELIQLKRKEQMEFLKSLEK